MNRTCPLIAVVLVVLVAACKPGTPSKYIQPDEMEDLLVDYYMARAIAQQEQISHEEREYHAALYTEAALKKHGISQAEFDSSLVYYYTRADRFDKIFERVTERLDEQALVLGASEGEIGKYAQYNATGDTANIWPDRTTALLLPMPPYNRWEFHIDADSTWRRGDELLLMFMSDYMFQTGTKDGMAYVAADYGDTVVGRNLHFATSGLSQLRTPQDTTRVVKAVKGFFYLNGGSEAQASTRLLFLSNVQLIRFHTRNEETETDSFSLDDSGERLPTDSLGDRVDGGAGDQLVPPDRRDGPDGVDVGRDSVET